MTDHGWGSCGEPMDEFPDNVGFGVRASPPGGVKRVDDPSPDAIDRIVALSESDWSDVIATAEGLPVEFVRDLIRRFRRACAACGGRLEATPGNSPECIDCGRMRAS